MKQKTKVVIKSRDDEGGGGTEGIWLNKPGLGMETGSVQYSTG